MVWGHRTTPQGFAHTEVDARRAQTLCDFLIGAQGTLNETSSQLMLKIIFAREPALKDMSQSALQIEYFHELANMMTASTAAPQ